MQRRRGAKKRSSGGVSGAEGVLKCAKTARGKREEEKRAPKLVENVKGALFMKGPKSGQFINGVLKDLHHLKKPHAQALQKHNRTRPFEDMSSVEYLSRVNDKSLFAYVSTSKKRPDNLILGRLFDHTLLDMVELGVNAATYRSIEHFTKVGTKSEVPIGSKPLFVFQGAAFTDDEDLAKLRNLLLDFFRGFTMEKINLAGIKHVIVCTAARGVVHFRHYGILLKKSGTRVPKVVLEERGPRLDLTVRRSKYAPEALQRAARKKPRSTHLKAASTKNVEISGLGDMTGRVHMKAQDLNKLQLRKMKGLKSADDQQQEQGQEETKTRKRAK